MEKYNLAKDEVQHIFLEAAHRYIIWAGFLAFEGPSSPSSFLSSAKSKWEVTIVSAMQKHSNKTD